jgi:hypothetical protein
MLQFGEAHYIGDIGGDQPPESKLYTLGSKSEISNVEACLLTSLIL